MAFNAPAWCEGAQPGGRGRKCLFFIGSFATRGRDVLAFLRNPFLSPRQISLSISSHCLRTNTAGHALTSGHKQALRHASESPLSTSQANVYTTVLGQGCPSALRAHTPATHTHTHTHTETREKAIRHVNPSSTQGTKPLKKGVSAALIAMRAFSSLRPRLLTRGLRTGAPRGYPSYPLFTSC